MAIPYSRTIIGGIPWYSVLIVTGILLAVFLAEREEKRLNLPKDTTVDLALVVVPCGIIGARLYYVAMTWEFFRHNPISVLYIWQGGVAIYGGVIGGALGAWAYARRKKLSFLRLADIVAPGLLLAQAIGRWGNYFNMEAYGPEIVNPLFQFFPLGVLIPADGGYMWHMATFFYESMWNLTGFFALWLIRKRQRKAGNLFFWYLLIYGSGRFIIEQLREDSLYLGGLRVSQYLSLALCALAAGLLLWRASRGDKRWFAVALGCLVAWLARWACLERHGLYALLCVAALAAALWLTRRRGLLVWLLCAAAALDALGMLAAWLGAPLSAGFAARLHALVCSLSLPVYMAALSLDDIPMRHK